MVGMSDANLKVAPMTPSSPEAATTNEKARPWRRSAGSLSAQGGELMLSRETR